MLVMNTTLFERLLIFSFSMVCLLGIVYCQDCSWPARWQSLRTNSHCYYSPMEEGDEQTYNGALNMCQAMGASLIIINTPGELQYLTERCKMTSCWIGVRWDQTRKKWVWQNGGDVANWLLHHWGESVHKGLPKYTLAMQNGLWVVRHTDERHHYICEIGGLCQHSGFKASTVYTFPGRFRLNEETGAFRQTIGRMAQPLTNGNRKSIKTRRQIATSTSSNPSTEIFPNLNDIRGKYEHARELQERFRQAVEKNMAIMRDLQEKFDSVKADTDKKLNDEIELLGRCISEMEGSVQSPESSMVCKGIISLPVFAETFDKADASLKLLTDKFEIVFRAEPIQTGAFFSLTKYRDISPGYGMRGIAHDPKRQRLVLHTTDQTNPLKISDYTGHIVATIGKEFPQLADSGYYRGLCVDTKRDVIVAASLGHALVLDFDGNSRGEIVVGGNLVAAAYSEELDLYALSDWDENRVYIVDPVSFNLLQAFGSTGSGDGQFDGPFSLSFGSIDGSSKVHLIVGDFNNHCLKIFDVDGQHFKTLGTEGSGPGELWGPSAVAVDPAGRVIACDLYNQRLVSFWLDDFGVQWKELLTASDLEFKWPAMLSVDTAARILAIGYAGYDTINIYTS